MRPLKLLEIGGAEIKSCSVRRLMAPGTESRTLSIAIVVNISKYPITNLHPYPRTCIHIQTYPKSRPITLFNFRRVREALHRGVIATICLSIISLFDSPGQFAPSPLLMHSKATRYCSFISRKIFDPSMRYTVDRILI